MLIKTTENTPWLPQPNRVELELTAELPAARLTTSAFVLAFQGDGLLLVNHRQRGWQVPGGHLEAGEPAQVAVRRECLEEVAVQLADLRVIARERLHIDAPCPAGYRYPYPDSYQVFYAARVARLLPFSPGNEIQGRRFTPPAEWAEEIWLQQYEALVVAARRVIVDGGDMAPAADEPQGRRPGQSFDQLVEERIQKAQARGDFADLPGKGKPVPLKVDPFVAPEVQFANKLLADGGFVPEWVDEAKEIDAALARCRALLHQGREPEAAALLGETVKKIRLYNLKAPSVSLQKRIPRLEELI